MSEQESRQVCVQAFRFLDQSANIARDIVVLLNDSTWSFGLSVPAKIDSNHVDSILVQVLNQFLIPPTMFGKSMHEAHRCDRIVDGPSIALELQAIGK